MMQDPGPDYGDYVTAGIPPEGGGLPPPPPHVGGLGQQPGGDPSISPGGGGSLPSPTPPMSPLTGGSPLSPGGPLSPLPARMLDTMPARMIENIPPQHMHVHQVHRAPPLLDGFGKSNGRIQRK